MKKLGLRAVAGGLAVLMAVAGFAPATANAADVLTAKASKTLVITADMVDDDGEIVISNENWDRIIVEKEVNAKDIYFDGVEVGELVVESGGESNIQLWDVEAEQVTVKEPELVNLDINEIRTLYADKETKAQAFELYMKTREDNKNTLTKVPSIVTMEDAVVESLSVSGSVDLNVAQGAVKAVTLEANAAVSQMNVTLNGYDGDVAYKGTEGFSVLNLNSVNCAIENLTVEGSATNNYLNVESKNSTTANVEVAGNAGLSLNIPIAKLDVVAGATAAQVSVLSTVDELNVTASNASVNVGADAKVAAATIVGDKVSMSGEGKLTKVDITGKDASVSTSGTGIKGENTYRPPVEKKPERPAAETLVYNFADLKPLIVHQATITEVENGGQKISTSDLYGQVHYTLPKTIQLGDYEKIIITMSDTTGGVGITPRMAGGWQGSNVSDKGFWWSREATDFVDIELNFNQMHYGWNYTLTEAELEKEITEICVQSCGKPTDFTIYRIVFLAKGDEVPPYGNDAPDAGDDTPVVPETAKEFYLKLWGNTKKDVAFELTSAENQYNKGTYIANAESNHVTYEGKLLFGGMVPEELANDELVAALETMEGAVQYIDKFVYEATLTEGVAADNAKLQFQGIAQNQNYSKGFYPTVDFVDNGDGTMTATAEVSMADISAQEWEGFANISIAIVGAKDGTTVAGTYSIKVVLK